MSNNKEVQVTLFYWKKVIIVAERKHQSVGSKKFRVETQLQKKPMIIFTHTIVNPRTVMIHSPNTVAAAATVMGTLWSHQITFVT